MGFQVARHEGDGVLEDADVEALLRGAGMSPTAWGNAPGDRYVRHRHEYHKVLYCVSGSIVFHIDDEDIQLRPGDRLEVEAGTDHSASVGSEGVRCVEGALRA